MALPHECDSPLTCLSMTEILHSGMVQASYLASLEFRSWAKVTSKCILGICNDPILSKLASKFDLARQIH